MYKNGYRKSIKHPMSIYCCCVLTVSRKLRSFNASRTDVINAFYNIVTLVSPPISILHVFVRLLS